MSRTVAILALVAATTLNVPVSDADEIQGAIGLGTAWQSRADYGAASRANYIPELVGFVYLPTSTPRLFLRPGARVGISGLAQAEMPSGLRITERDLSISAEMGAVYDGLVIPSICLGGGLTGRHSRLDVKAPISAGQSNIGGVDLLPFGFAQLGLGIPIGQGSLVLEPFVRAELTLGDSRSHWRYGVDLTIALF